MTGYWRELDHTADLAIKVYGPDLESFFENSSRGLISLAFDPGTRPVRKKCDIQLAAPDIESLLIDWLNELLYLSEKHNVYFTDFTFHTLTPGELLASVESRASHRVKQYIKAATFHNLIVIQDNEGFHTEIVFDL